MEESYVMVRNTCQTVVPSVCAEMDMFIVSHHFVQWQNVVTPSRHRESAALDVILVVYLFFYYIYILIWFVPVKSYGNVGTVSSPNHTFFLGKLV